MVDDEGNGHEKSSQADGEAEQPQLDITEWFNEHGGRLVLFVAFASAITAIALGSVYSDELTQEGESLARVIRDVGFAAAIPPSAILALWRGCVAQSLAESNQRQAYVALQGHLNERYQKGVELLADAQIMVRIGGIHSLRYLAVENPLTHCKQIIQLLCGFARHPSGLTLGDSASSPRDASEAISGLHHEWSQDDTNEDVLSAVRAAAICAQSIRAHLDDAGGFHTFFQGTILRGAYMPNVDLTRADLDDANLTRVFGDGCSFNRSFCGNTSFIGASLSRATFVTANLISAQMIGSELVDADFRGAKLRNTELGGADLTGAILTDAMLIGTRFVYELDEDEEAPFWVSDLVEVDGRRFLVARGLTQAQLNEAWVDPEDPPVLDHIVDAETGRPLVWQGGQVLKQDEAPTASD